MFVKLLALLISNVLVSFSVLLCCKSLTSICGLKGENDLKRRFGVPANALEPSEQDRVHRASVQVYLYKNSTRNSTNRFAV
jgi:hypothetical protein